jgi:phytoene synthase
MTTPASRAMCYQAMARGSRSFWLASTLLPAPCRYDVAALYAWCRRWDDAVDHAPPGTSEAALRTLQVELDAVYAPVTPPDVMLAAFQEVVRAYEIPIAYPRELLNGLAMDVRGARYESMDDLLLYSFRVAGTVGLMICHIFGVSDPRALRRAAHMGIAMQITNICRDVLEDWKLGRVYIPRALLREAGAGSLPDEIGGPLPTAAREPLSVAVRKLLGEAERFYRSGEAGIPWLPWRFGMATRAARLVYSSIGRLVEQRDCDVFKGRAIVPLPSQLRLWARALAESLWHAPTKLPGELPSTVSETLTFPADILPIEPPHPEPVAAFAPQN